MARGAVAQQVTQVILQVFRLNGTLLRTGDDLVRPLGLTSARWQMLGAVRKSERPLTTPQLADAMGVTRQGAQRQLDLLVEGGLLKQLPNPDHRRSPVYALTARGRDTYRATLKVQKALINRVARGLTRDELLVAARVLSVFESALREPLPEFGHRRKRVRSTA